ncbi:MAG: hypothetical protein IK020_09550 [Clostridiales bacterium]|nr:hypothetical protein [Clostridiales bacterium]
MATLCKSCGHPLIYDPGVKKMLCTTCGSTFAAEEVESEAKKYREDETVKTRAEIFGEDGEPEEEFLENYVYTCSECGGEIVIHGSEASTTCVFCGNPNVVFSRVAKDKRPDYIVPFSVTKEQAVQAIRDKVAQSLFVPKQIKNFTAESVRGIYVPFWIVEAEYEESCLISSTVGHGEDAETIRTGKRGWFHMTNFPVDACAILSNESSARLEPYNLKAMKPFDEDYLLGFYSNASDITYDEMWEVTEKRAQEIFEEDVKKSVSGRSPKIETESHVLSILDNYKYAMLPVWFVTFTYQGEHHTVLVNGQTRKVVCGLPWRKPLFWAITIGIGAILSFLSFFVFLVLFSSLFSFDSSSSDNESSVKMILLIIGGIIAIFTSGAVKISNVLHQIELTRSSQTFNFVKKRQE